MGIDHYYQIMIKEVFAYKNKWDSFEIGSDFFGDYFLYHYPGYDINKYYYDKNVILKEWKTFYNIKISMIKSIKNDIYDEFGIGNLQKPVLYYNNKFYIVLNAHNFYIGSYRKSGKTFDQLEFQFIGKTDYTIIKTELGFKRILKKLELKEINF